MLFAQPCLHFIEWCLRPYRRLSWKPVPGHNEPCVIINFNTRAMRVICMAIRWCYFNASIWLSVVVNICVCTHVCCLKVVLISIDPIDAGKSSGCFSTHWQIILMVYSIFNQNYPTVSRNLNRLIVIGDYCEFYGNFVFALKFRNWCDGHLASKYSGNLLYMY